VTGAPKRGTCHRVRVCVRACMRACVLYLCVHACVCKSLCLYVHVCAVHVCMCLSRSVYVCAVRVCVCVCRQLLGDRRPFWDHPSPLEVGVRLRVCLARVRVRASVRVCTCAVKGIHDCTLDGPPLQLAVSPRPRLLVVPGTLIDRSATSLRPPPPC
jgi:hypothetical protein